MSSRDHLAMLRKQAPVVLPSLLLCDFGNLEREVARLEEAGAGALHLDVMDGHFVPNLTYGMPIVSALRRLTKLPLDVHLMISEPGKYLEQFREAGADIITVHVETVDDAPAIVRRIKDLGAGAGLAINPSTPLDSIEKSLQWCDLVLVMSVEAGFGGQSFNPVALDRLNTLREKVGQEVLLEVDGGINDQTIHQCAQAGAKLFVVGSALFRHERYEPVVRELTDLARV